MRSALRRSFGPIVASGATVALGLLALLLSDLTNNRALGPVGAIGMVCAVLSTLTFLPAVLILLGRVAYWPAKPRSATEKSAGQGVWTRIASLVDRAPRKVWAATLLGLLICAAFAPSLQSKGVPLNEIFVNDAPSVAAQKTLGKHFPGGSGNPAVVIADADRAEQVTAAVERTEGVSSAATVGESGRPGAKALVVDGRVRIDATLEDAADSDAAKGTVARLRDNVHAVDGADELVGGYTAQQYDTQRTAEDDRMLIVPVVLTIILVILIGLLRSLLMPVLLVATVALNFLATLGVSALFFQHVLGFGGADSSVPLYGFVFLVALGVDYNIFLMSRVREESLRNGAREGVLRGLTGDRRCHHIGRSGARGHLRGPRRHPAGLPRPDRLHRRFRRPPGHPGRTVAPGAGAGARHRPEGVVAGGPQPYVRYPLTPASHSGRPPSSVSRTSGWACRGATRPTPGVRPSSAAGPVPRPGSRR